MEQLSEGQTAAGHPDVNTRKIEWKSSRAKGELSLDLLKLRPRIIVSNRPVCCEWNHPIKDDERARSKQRNCANLLHYKTSGVQSEHVNSASLADRISAMISTLRAICIPASNGRYMNAH